MTRILTYGYEQQEVLEDPSNGDLQGTAPTINTTVARSGNACMQVASSSFTSAHRVFSFINTFGRSYYLRVYFRADGATPTNQTKIVRLIPNNIEQGTVRFETNGTLSLYNGAGTQVGSSSATISANTWYRVEMEINIPAAGNGTLGFYLNGVPIARSNNVSVGNSVTNGNFMWGTSGATPGVNLFFDDIAFNDDQGSFQCGLPSSGKVVFLFPISDNARVGFTTGGGGTTNLFDAVNNTPPVGVAPASATATSQIVDANNNSTDTYSANLAAYTTAVASGGGGMAANDIVTLAQALVRGGNSTTTARRMNIQSTSNPAITETFGFSVSGTAAGTETTGWTIAVTAPLYSPSVTLGNSPVIRVRKGTASVDTITYDLMGLYVEYISPTQGSSLSVSGAG